jgi:hypothetical protein
MSKINATRARWRKPFWMASIMILSDSYRYLDGNRLVMAQYASPAPVKQPIKRNPIRSKPWVLEKILELLNPKKKSPIPRGEEICTISPVFQPNQLLLWTQRPLLVWKGNAKLIRLIDVNSKQVIWEKEVTPNLPQLRIDQPLKAGRRYIWQAVADLHNDINNPKVEFQVVDKAQWQKIDRDLKLLGQQLASQKLDSEQIALERVKYFAQLQMWGDVTEIIYSLSSEVGENPNFRNLKTKIANELSVSDCIRLSALD